MKDFHQGFGILGMVLVLLCILSRTAYGQGKELTPEEVVIEANKAEYALYNELESKQAAERLEQFFTGARLKDIQGRVQRAIKRKDKTKSAYNVVKVVGQAEIRGDTAIVHTTENGELEWVSGIRWPEHGPTKNLPHTYTLVMIGGVWKVEKDEFEQ